MNVSRVEPASAARPAPALFGWLREGTPSARRGLLAASLGWMLDGFDIMLYALVIGALLRDFSISTATAGLLGSLTLVASGIGGVLFGAIADRFGRRRAMIGSILVYSIFTAACGLAQTIWHLGIFRFLLGLGISPDSGGGPFSSLVFYQRSSRSGFVAASRSRKSGCGRGRHIRRRKYPSVKSFAAALLSRQHC